MSKKDRDEQRKDEKKKETREGMATYFAPTCFLVPHVILHSSAAFFDALERALGLGQGSLDIERAVLAEYGNMSAPTAFFVLQRLITAGLPSRTLLTAMGPGFTASCISLRKAA